MTSLTNLPGQPFFSYKENQLFVENCSIQTLAKEYGTPLFVYSKAAINHALAHYRHCFTGRDSLICYAVKANSNIAILKMLADLGCGFDIVSGGELARVLEAGASANKVIFSGVGKSAEEMIYALKMGIKCFNVESEEELLLLNEIAITLNMKAPISIRVNPNVDAKTHPYISTGMKNNKFGISQERALHAYLTASEMNGISIKGIDCHIGSQIIDEQPFLDAMDKIIETIETIEQAGITLSHIDFGGGIGIRYDQESPICTESLWKKLFQKLDKKGFGNKTIMIEPGRSLIANTGVCAMQVLYIKHGDQKNFCIVDAAMTELPRPALYDAYHRIEPVMLHENASLSTFDVVGPVCESGDWLGKSRSFSVNQGDILALFSAGAYCMSMASNYNSRPTPAEILVDGDRSTLIRKRQSTESLWLNEVY